MESRTNVLSLRSMPLRSMLIVDGDDIVAIGVIGLVYGQRNNLEGGEFADGVTPANGGGRHLVRA